MTGKRNTLQIRTPEGIVFSQSLAGPVIRFLAWFMDFMAIATLTTFLSFLLGLVIAINPDFGGALAAIGYFVIAIGYGITCEWRWRGQTVGKRLLRLRVVDASGLPLRFQQVVIRNLLRFVDSLPMFYFVGGVTALVNRRTQRLGDLAANTVVVHLPEIGAPDVGRLLAGKYNSLRRHPHLGARLRQRVTPVEAAIVLQALLRREEFEPAARVELYAEIAAHFRARAEFPPEATEGVADEQYLLNVVDVLYPTAKGRSEGAIRQ